MLLQAQVPQMIHFQGRVTVNGAPFAGPTGSFKFTLVNSGGTTTYWSNDGTSTAGSQPVAAVSLPVSRGLYSVLLGDTSIGGGMTQPIGTSVFVNSDVRLRVWFGDGVNGFQLLSPDQRIAAVGYAIMAGSVPDGTITAGKLASDAKDAGMLAGGTLSDARLSSNVTLRNGANSFAGTLTLTGALDARGGIFNTAGNLAINDGLDVTGPATFQGSVNAASFAGSGSGLTGLWKLGGNASGTPLELGTTDNQPLEFKVNNQRGLRLEYATDEAFVGVNVIGGYSGNVANSGVVGGTIAGGGSIGWANRIEGDFATIGGGRENKAKGYQSTVGGGFGNTAGNTASDWEATVGGGYGNTASGLQATVGGGEGNKATGEHATVPGGQANTAVNYAFAAGRRAQATNDGAFVWADSTDTDFGSTANNQFLVRASGGVGIGRNNPATALDVNGIVTATGFAGSGALLSLGTTDNQPLEFKVNNQRGLRLEYFLGSVNVIGGYSGNVVSNSFTSATIAGGGADGYESRIGADYATIGGGARNTNTGTSATIGGGFDNTASGPRATIGGGHINTASGFMATVGGGESNRAAGFYATVPGGQLNTATDYAFAAGYRAKATNQGAFVWADSQDADFGSTANNQFLIRASGGVGIGATNPLAMLHIVNQGVTPDPTALENDDLIVSAEDAAIGLYSLNIGTYGSALSLKEINGAGLITDAWSWVRKTSAANSEFLLTYGASDNYANNPAQMVVRTNGFVGIGRVPGANQLEVEGNASKSAAGGFLANSDRRIKTGIRPLTNALEIINRVRPVGFRYNENYRREHPSIMDVEYYNVVAQEFAEVFPNSVQKGGDKFAGGEEILQVDTYPATIYSIAAIQGLHQIVKDKELEIQALQERVGALERLVKSLAKVHELEPD